MERCLLFLTLCVMVVCTSCVNNKIATPAGANHSGRYGSEFPSQNATDALEKITHSIKKVYSASSKEKQENWVKDLSSCGPFTVLATDQATDIAILGKNCESLSDTVIPFACPPGKALDLQWGSFVYIFGYPMGNQVITKGIASPGPKRPMGEFSVDALLNKGYSGGVILAIRNGVPNFELVGMVKSVNSTHEEFLKPAPDQQRTPDWIPYKGDAYTGSSDNIQYGLNAVVPFESILEFYRKNRNDLVSMGYNLDNFFTPGQH